MSEREFDNFLALLGGLLRLSAKQRTEIAGELRDHLEERLAELTAAGAPRDEAVERALAEFGDAASMAAAFLSVSRNRRKRWIMKWTAASIGTLAVAALLAVALWPEGANVKLTPKAVAQVAPPGAPVAPKKEDAKTKEDNNAATEVALARQIAAEFVETPLGDVIYFLRDLTDVEFYVNWKKLEGEGIAKDAAITIQLKKVRVDMLLDLALAQAGDNAAYVLRDGIVIVSSAADLENATEVRVYNCRDLLKLSTPGDAMAMMGMGSAAVGYASSGTGGPGAMAGPGGGPSGMPGMPDGGGGMGRLGGGMGSVDAATTREERLMRILTTAIQPESWQDSGGFGTVAEYSGLLVVSHNARTHRQIEKVLAMLREAVAKDAAAAKTTAMPPKR